MKYLLLSFISLFFVACNPSDDIGSIPTFNDKGQLLAVIEIPAGTNKKIEYNYSSKQFEVDLKNGKEREIAYLPYLGNYGFIPSTFSDPEIGGDGDAVDILVIGEWMNAGSVISVKPIAMLQLIDDGEEDFKIIAVPTEDGKNVLKVNNFEDVQNHKKGLLDIIETWFLNYDSDPAESLGWTDEHTALEYIRKNMKNNH